MVDRSSVTSMALVLLRIRQSTTMTALGYWETWFCVVLLQLYTFRGLCRFSWTIHLSCPPPSEKCKHLLSFTRNFLSESSCDRMELRCVVAVIRHGDRTPKQKMKMEVRHPRCDSFILFSCILLFNILCLLDFLRCGTRTSQKLTVAIWSWRNLPSCRKYWILHASSYQKWKRVQPIGSWKKNAGN